MNKHIFYIRRGDSIISSGYYNEGRFVVLKGSVYHYSSILSPIAKGQTILEEDMEFPSPSAAGCYCLNKRTCNGWTEWKDKNGNTLDSVYRKKTVEE